MAKRLSETLTTMSDEDLWNRLESPWATKLHIVEAARRKFPATRPARKVTKSTVSRGRGHAKRATRPTGGAIRPDEVLMGSLRQHLPGSQVAPWIRHAMGRADVI